MNMFFLAQTTRADVVLKISGNFFMLIAAKNSIPAPLRSLAWELFSSEKSQAELRFLFDDDSYPILRSVSSPALFISASTFIIKLTLIR